MVEADVVTKGAGRIVKPMIGAIVVAIGMACAAAAEAPTATVGNLEAVRDGDSETVVLLARVAVGAPSLASPCPAIQAGPQGP